MSIAASRTRVVWATLGNGFRWWREGLEAALPSRFVRLFAGDRRCVRIIENGDGPLQAALFATPFATKPLVEIRFCDQALEPGPKARTIATAARSVPVILEAPASKILTQTVRTPAAVLENIDDAVRFGLTTWTPFAAEDVVFQANVMEKTEEHLRVRIQIVPLTALRPVIERAAQAGLPVSAIAFGADLVRFGDAGDLVERRRRRATRIDLGLAASAFALGCGLLVVLHLGWERKLDDLQTSIRAEIARRATRAKLEGELNQLEARRRAVLGKRAAEVRVSLLIADLAERLPESAEVLEFEWAGKRGRLRATVPENVNLGDAIGTSSLVTANRGRTGRDDGQFYELTARVAE